jgi:hypothetical protein
MQGFGRAVHGFTQLAYICCLGHISVSNSPLQISIHPQSASSSET